MRPSEARNLHTRHLTLPDGDGWGIAIVSGSHQVAGKNWTDDGAVGEDANSNTGHPPRPGGSQSHHHSSSS